MKNQSLTTNLMRTMATAIFLMAYLGNVKSVKAFTPPIYVTLTIYRLFPNGTSTGIPCVVGDPEYHFGCAAEGQGGYPYNANPMTLSFEKDYLLDVVPRELPDYYDPVAIQAQAVAARTYAYWHINHGNVIDNSNSYQVFTPGTFINNGNAPNNQVDPCASTNLSRSQLVYCNALTPVQYLAQHDSDSPMFTEYSSDWTLRTVAGFQPGLISVDDRISIGCDADNSGHGRGMSQEGASRWASGNHCSYTGAGNQPYSVQWENSEQILYHYYTNADLRDQNAYLIGATYRWVPLEFNWFTVDNLPRFNTGDARSVEITIQNAGSVDWICTYPTYSYELHYRWRNSIYGTYEGANIANMCSLTKGDPTRAVDVLINDVPSTPFNGTPWYLEFDIYRIWTGGTQKFSDMGWESFDVNACYNGFCNTALLPILQSTFSSISSVPTPPAPPRNYVPNVIKAYPLPW